MTKNIEIRTIETNGIAVTVKVDYDAGTVSLVERVEQTQRYNGTDIRPYIPKRYLFANRGLAYRKGWSDILEAMQVAMEAGFEDLEEETERRSEQFAESLVGQAVSLKK